MPAEKFPIPTLRKMCLEKVFRGKYLLCRGAEGD